MSKQGGRQGTTQGCSQGKYVTVNFLDTILTIQRSEYLLQPRRREAPPKIPQTIVSKRSSQTSIFSKVQHSSKISHICRILSLDFSPVFLVARATWERMLVTDLGKGAQKGKVWRKIPEKISLVGRVHLCHSYFVKTVELGLGSVGIIEMNFLWNVKGGWVEDHIMHLAGWVGQNYWQVVNDINRCARLSFLSFYWAFVLNLINVATYKCGCRSKVGGRFTQLEGGEVYQLHICWTVFVHKAFVLREYIWTPHSFRGLKWSEIYTTVSRWTFPQGGPILFCPIQYSCGHSPILFCKIQYPCGHNPILLCKI